MLCFNVQNSACLCKLTGTWCLAAVHHWISFPKHFIQEEMGVFFSCFLILKAWLDWEGLCIHLSCVSACFVTQVLLQVISSPFQKLRKLSVCQQEEAWLCWWQKIHGLCAVPCGVSSREHEVIRGFAQWAVLNQLQEPEKSFALCSIPAVWRTQMMKVHGRSGDRNQEFSSLDGRSDKEEIN